MKLVLTYICFLSCILINTERLYAQDDFENGLSLLIQKRLSSEKFKDLSYIAVLKYDKNKRMLSMLNEPSNELETYLSNLIKDPSFMSYVEKGAKKSFIVPIAYYAKKENDDNVNLSMINIATSIRQFVNEINQRKYSLFNPIAYVKYLGPVIVKGKITLPEDISAN